MHAKATLLSLMWSWFGCPPTVPRGSLWWEDAPSSPGIQSRGWPCPASPPPPSPPATPRQHLSSGDPAATGMHMYVNKSTFQECSMLSKYSKLQASQRGGGIGCRGVHNDVLLGSILILDDNDAESDRHWCCVESGYRVCALPLYSPVVFVHISGMHADARGAIVTGCRWGWQVNHTCGAPTGGPGGRPHPLDTVLPGPGLRCWVCVKTLGVCDTCWWGLTYIQDIRV